MLRIVIATATLCAALPTSAEIVPSAAGGFASSHSAVVVTDRAETWAMLLGPENWWSHTWSDDSANLHLDAKAGGCFCETIPDSGDGQAGSVEHMRVVAVFPETMLRMVGALGPLQSEGLAGALTVTLSDAPNGGTKIAWDYVLAGHSRMSLEQLAPVVDGVQGEFLGGLVEALGGEAASRQ